MSNLQYQDKPSTWSSHARIATRLESIPVGSKILDNGTASGMFASRNRDIFLRFYGIEPSKEWAAIARPFCEKMWICSFDEEPDKALRGYDTVDKGDLLEHVPKPEIALNNFSGLQTTGCV
jgi:2-polyprenyl-3-methyl-5-hydroxy-6-metoxy-1,4-benzoquinol methylase